MPRARQPRGVPSGGEFAGNDHDEAGGSLSDTDDAEYGEWEGPNDPALTGYDPDKYRHVGEYLGRHRPKPEDTLYLTRTQMNTALNDPDGKKAKGVARVFEIDALNGGGAREITAPKDGTPVVILSRGGHTTFRVRSGRAVISVDDISGSVIEAESGANVIILARDNCEVTVRAAEGSTVTIVAHGGSSGRLSGDGNVRIVHPEGVVHSIVNETTDGFLPNDGRTPF